MLAHSFYKVLSNLKIIFDQLDHIDMLVLCGCNVLYMLAYLIIRFSGYEFFQLKRGDFVTIVQQLASCGIHSD
jgi:hypothetical protein